MSCWNSKSILSSEQEDGQLHDHSDNLFSRFYISGRDIAAFFADCVSSTQPFDWGSRPSFPSSSQDADKFYSLIDRCGIAVIVDQVYFTNMLCKLFIMFCIFILFLLL